MNVLFRIPYFFLICFEIFFFSKNKFLNNKIFKFFDFFKMGNAAIASAQKSNRTAQRMPDSFSTSTIMKGRKSRISASQPQPQKNYDVENKIKFLISNMTYDSIKRGSKLTDLIQRSDYSDHGEIIETLKVLSELVRRI